MLKRILAFLTLTVSGALVTNAQTQIVKPDLSIPSLVAPAYFGPNAFPVPDMSDGTTSDKLKVELAADGFVCSATSSLSDDVTADLFARLTVPLFTDRVNLVV